MTGLSVSAGNSITVDASSATDANPTYTVSCGNVTSSHERINSITRTGCEYEIRAGREAGTASFSFELISRDSDGTIQSTGNFQITITITELSNIIFTVPTDLVVQAGSAIIINAADYATDGSYTITCGDAVASSLVSVTRTADTCTFTATAAASTTVVPLSAGFSVPYTSSGGDSYNGRINITINPTSNIIFTAPTDLEIGAGNTRTVNLLAGYATDTIYTITCGNATASDTARLTLIERNGCDYTITAAADATQGDTTFTLTYTSTGTDTHDATITIDIGPPSEIIFTAPSQIPVVPAGTTMTIDVGSYVEDGLYTIICAAATDVDENRIASIVNNGCSYTVTAAAVLGEATFTVPYRSTGGDTMDSAVTVRISAPPAPSRRTGIVRDASADDPPPVFIEAAEPDELGLRWVTFTVQQGGTTALRVLRAMGLPDNQSIWYWSTRTLSWMRVISPSQRLPSGTMISFQIDAEVSQDRTEVSNLGSGTQQASLTRGWNIVSLPAGVIGLDGENSMLDTSLTDCRQRTGVIAIANLRPGTDRWQIRLLCQPQTEARLTTGEDAEFDLLTSIQPGDFTYFFYQSPIATTIVWDADLLRYQPR